MKMSNNSNNNDIAIIHFFGLRHGFVPIQSFSFFSFLSIYCVWKKTNRAPRKNGITLFKTIKKLDIHARLVTATWWLIKTYLFVPIINYFTRRQPGVHTITSGSVSKKNVPLDGSWIVRFQRNLEGRHEKSRTLEEFHQTWNRYLIFTWSLDPFGRFLC